jgi:hypothetical protein
MKVMTANRLADGEAVWLAADHSWCGTIDGAEVAQTPQMEEKLMRAGTAAFLKDEVVDVNLINVEIVDGRIVPTRLREKIRAAGPTNRLDLGKQAAGPQSRAA